MSSSATEADRPVGITETERELAEANSELELELLQTAADTAGLIDPTPISDLTGASLALYQGDLIGAGLSLISVVPLVGDALGKTVKGTRAAQRIARLRSRISGLIERLRSLRKSAKPRDVAQDAARAAKKAPSSPPTGCVPCQAAKAQGRKLLQRHSKAVERHRAKYEKIVKRNARAAKRLDEIDPKEAERLRDANRGYTAHVTEARGEALAADHIGKTRPQLDMVQGFEPGKGFDQVYAKRGPNGEVDEIVIVEAKGSPGGKMSKHRPDKNLPKDEFARRNKADQMSRDWVRQTARDMVRSSDKSKRALGKRILTKLREGKVRGIGVRPDPKTGQATEFFTESYGPSIPKKPPHTGGPRNVP